MQNQQSARFQFTRMDRIVCIAQPHNQLPSLLLIFLVQFLSFVYQIRTRGVGGGGGGGR